MTRAPTTVSSRAGSAAVQLSGNAGNTSQSCPRVTLEIGVFFDGTMNNEANAIQGGSGTSYQNARTNVSLLKDLYKSGTRYNVRNACGGFARKYRSLYVQGPGTQAGQDDAWSLDGAAFGMGATGIESRVYGACIEVGNIIRIESPGTEPEEIIMDVFGFSRGAAAARYFVNCFRQGYIMYDRYFVNRQRAQLPPGRRIRFRFIGIFDTVAAVGIGSNDDNGPVNVHLKTAQATRIYHLTAQDEYRQNFRLNHNIPGGGDTRALPGAHSDVGGGYRGQGDEVTTQSRVSTHRTASEAQTARDRLEAQNRAQSGAGMDVWRQEGWVDGEEPAGTQRFVLGPTTPIFSRIGTIIAYQFSVRQVLSRPWVQPGLSRIAMRIMYDQAVGSGVPFLVYPTSTEYAVPAPIAAIGNRMIAGGSPTDAERRTLLRNYGHVSSNAGSIGMAAESNHRRVIYPNQPGQAK